MINKDNSIEAAKQHAAWTYYRNEFTEIIRYLRERQDYERSRMLQTYQQETTNED